VKLEDFIAASTGIAVFWNELVCGMVYRYVLMAWKKMMLAPASE
jgi:flagellar biosynthesis protein FliP